MLSFPKRKPSSKHVCPSGLIDRINRYIADTYTPPEPPKSSPRYSISPRKTYPSDDALPSKEQGQIANEAQHCLPSANAQLEKQTEKSAPTKDIRFSVSPLNSHTDNFHPGFRNPLFNEILGLDRPVAEIDAHLEKAVEMSFVDRLLRYIGEKNLRDSQVYKAAQIDRKLFSKIASNRHYTPSKDTCLALCFALQLSLEETKDLLSRAEHALTHSNKRDIVIEYLIRERVYNLFEVNEILYRLDMKPFGP